MQTKYTEYYMSPKFIVTCLIISEQLLINIPNGIKTDYSDEIRVSRLLRLLMD